MYRDSKKKSKKELILKVVNALQNDESLHKLQFELAVKLNHIEFVNRVIYEYVTKLRDAIPTLQNRVLFEKWMIQIAYFLGSHFYDHYLFFKFNEEHKFFNENKKFKIAFKNFIFAIKELVTPLIDHHQLSKKVERVAILYPECSGGGHKTVTLAIADELKSRGFKIEVLDTDTFEKPYDPTFQGLTRTEIYVQIYQQESNREKALYMWKEVFERHPIEDRKYMKDLLETLRNLQADHLLVVSHHQPEMSFLSYQLGIPTTFVHTDNHFHSSLYELLFLQQYIEHSLVSFTCLSEESDFFLSILERFNTHHYNELDEKIRRQMVYLDYPIRPSFQPVSFEEKNVIRDRLGIEREAIVVKIAMGSYGIPQDIESIITQLMSEANKVTKLLHIFVICGSNQKLKNALEENAQFKNQNHLKFAFLGYLDEKSMSDFDKSTDVWITKLGGATCAEAKLLNKQILYIRNEHYPWEWRNAKVLEKLNLAQEVDFSKNLIDQIYHRASIGQEVEFKRRDEIKNSWGDQLFKIVTKTALPILYSKE